MIDFMLLNNPQQNVRKVGKLTADLDQRGRMIGSVRSHLNYYRVPILVTLITFGIRRPSGQLLLKVATFRKRKSFTNRAVMSFFSEIKNKQDDFFKKKGTMEILQNDHKILYCIAVNKQTKFVYIVKCFNFDIAQQAQ